MNRPILVGIDGSKASIAALEWATREAALRSTSLRLAHVCPWPLFSGAADPRRTAKWVEARHWLFQAESLAQELVPGIEVSGDLVADDPAAALVRWADEVDLVVLGNQGNGGFPGLVLGSVAFKVAGHAPAPVVLVPAIPRAPADTPEIVVGVDRLGTEPALRLAFQEAALHGIRLRVLHAYRSAFPVPANVEGKQERDLADVVAIWRKRFPGVEVVTQVVDDSARHAMVHASSQAELLVVGSRDHGGFYRMPLGTVTYTLAHHATCPLMIARGP